MGTVQHRDLTGEELHPPGVHAEQHAAGQADVITPAAIGAAATDHLHDDRYYTEAETDTLLGEKAQIGHTHDDRYATTSQVVTLVGEHAEPPLGNPTQDGMVLSSTTAGVRAWIAVGGSGGPAYPTYHFAAASLLYFPEQANNTNGGWPRDFLPAAGIELFGAITVASFDDTSTESVGQQIWIPDGATTMTMRVMRRAKTFTTSQTVLWQFGLRQVISDAAYTPTQYTDTIAAAGWNVFTQTITLATAGLTVHREYLMQWTRAGGTLNGDVFVSSIVITFA